MNAEADLTNLLREQWLECRERLVDRHLLADRGSLSLRWPGASMMWFGLAADVLPTAIAWADPASLAGPASVHAGIYRLRSDVGAVAGGGGLFGARLAAFGGVLPPVFDEQARHLGPMAPAVGKGGALGTSLAVGGNALLVDGAPFFLGATATRMAQNAELFEKCATAYVLATAAGAAARPLPWLVRWIANGRLKKDQRRAAERFAAGLLPEESKGY